MQWLVPLMGWRPLFWLLAGGVAGLDAADRLGGAGLGQRAHAATSATRRQDAGYAAVWRDPFFRKLMPIGFFNYGGFVAMLTLWVVPWLTRVAGYAPREAADALFWISIAMLVTYWLWGAANPVAGAPRHRRRPADRLGPAAQPWRRSPPSWCSAPRRAPWRGRSFCAARPWWRWPSPRSRWRCRPALAGRALSAYNLVVFLGVFVVQWGVGLLIDLFGRAGFDTVGAFRGALGAVSGLLRVVLFLLPVGAPA